VNFLTVDCVPAHRQGDEDERRDCHEHADDEDDERQQPVGARLRSRAPDHRRETELLGQKPSRLREKAARPLGELWANERKLGGEWFVERELKRGHRREDSGPAARAHPSFG
jgi:hypothetical protein